MVKSRRQRTSNTSELMALTKHELDWLEREVELRYAELDAMHNLTERETRKVRRDLVKSCLRFLRNEKENNGNRSGIISELRSLAFES